MELRHLRYFIAVAEHENIHTASARLHVTQPAISRQIHDLEGELGFALFERSSKGLKLTRPGELFLGEANKILASLANAVQAGRRVHAGFRGRLKISLVESVGWHGYVPEIVGEFQHVAPEVAIELAPNPTVAQLRAVFNEEVDGGFMYPFDPQPDTLSIVPLTKHNVVLAVPRKWGMPDDANVFARDMARRPFVTFPRHLQPQFHDRLFSACSKAGLTLNVVQEAPTDTAILSLVSAGIGAAILNSANFGRPPMLTQFLQLQDVSIELPFSFVYRSANRSPVLAQFVEVVKTVRDRSHDGNVAS